MMDLQRFAGTWKKTNEKPQWIDSLTVDAAGGDLFVEIFGSSAPSPPVWGRAKAEVLFASNANTTDTRAGAFIANYRFDDCDVEVQANLNLGLLVVATFVNFKNGSGYQDRFTREFFWFADGTQAGGLRYTGDGR